MSKIPNCKCKICGKLYRICADARRLNSWRLIACSPECYQEWLKRIDSPQEKEAQICETVLKDNEAEGKATQKNEVPERKKSKKNTSESGLDPDSDIDISSENLTIE